MTPLKKTARPAVATVLGHGARSPSSRSIDPSGCSPSAPSRELLPEAAGHEQGVVDAQAEARAASRGSARRCSSGVIDATTAMAPSATSTATPPTTTGHARRDDAAEHHQERERREGQADAARCVAGHPRTPAGCRRRTRGPPRGDVQARLRHDGAPRTGSRASGERSGGRSSVTTSYTVRAVTRSPGAGARV